jgi:allophanate hydrolase
LDDLEATLLTLADWRAAVAEGTGIWGLLQARLRRLQQQAAPHVWISRVDEATLAARITQLEHAAAGLSPAQCLQRWPLFGVPFAAKDNIDAEGFETTAACPAWAHRPTQSATVVQRLLDAGAVLMGKTNLDQFATGLVGTRSPYGAPESAWVPGHVSGGSSSGSAVAVARGEVAFSLGTDTAGSGRVPAGFNHIVGLKPTPGRVSTAGVLPACRSIDCVSVFTLTVDDAAAVLAVLEGPDEADDYSAFVPGPQTLQRTPGRPLRVGVPRDAVVDAAQGYDAAWQQAQADALALGAELVPLDFAPLHAVARQLYEGPWVAERWLAVHDLLARNPAALDATVAGIIRGAQRFNAADAFAGQYAVQHGRREGRKLWQQVDVLMVPTAPRHPSLADLAAEPVAANALLGTYTNFVNLLGWCALALPAGFTRLGRPFGVTFIAPGAADAALATWGRRWQAQVAQPLGATGRVWAPQALAEPLPLPATEPTLRLAVVGAHLSGLPLNGQLVERGAVLEQATHTAPRYRLHALPGTTPPKPGLVRVGAGETGHAIALEVWRMPLAQVGSFLALIPAPLGLGTLELADGSTVHGFLCEAAALPGAPDISALGGWRAYLAQATR